MSRVSGAIMSRVGTYLEDSFCSRVSEEIISAPTFAMSRRLLSWISAVLEEVQSLSTVTA